MSRCILLSLAISHLGYRDDIVDIHARDVQVAKPIIIRVRGLLFVSFGVGVCNHNSGITLVSCVCPCAVSVDAGWLPSC